MKKKRVFIVSVLMGVLLAFSSGDIIAQVATQPTVTTRTVSFIGATVASSGGNVTDDGGAAVTSRGVCWSTSPNPTTADSFTTDGTGTGYFTSRMRGLSPDTTYYVRAYATNSAGTAYGNEETFKTLPSYIILTSPNGGENWVKESSQNINWNSGGVTGNVKIEYSTNNGGNWIQIVASTTNDGHYSWTVPGAQSKQCLVRVSETDGSPSDTSDNCFTIFSFSDVTVTSPDGGENWQVGSIQTITWTSIGIVGNVNLRYSINNGGHWTDLASDIKNDGSHPWTVPDVVSDQCLIGISDTSGRFFDASDGVFSIGIFPLITVTSPNGGETWPCGSIQDITWTAPGISGNLKITLWKDGHKRGIIANGVAPASGSYAWRVGNLGWIACPVGTGFRVKIEEIGTSVEDISDSTFRLTRR